jgi:hypothetical protein
MDITNGGDLTVTGLINTRKGINDTTGTGGALRIELPGGAAYATTGPITGSIKIRLPVLKTSTNTMLMMRVKVYEYNGDTVGTSRVFEIGGYNYAPGGWYNVFACQTSMNGVTALNVRYGYDAAGYSSIWIGETGTIWQYPQVFVTEFEAGYSGYAASTWASNWGVTFETSFNTIETGPIAASIPANSSSNNANTASQVSVVTTGTNATFYPTFVDSDNGTGAYESLYTDSGISYNPSTNLLTISGSLNLSSTTAATATAILTRGADSNFQLTAQNGVASNASGQEVSRFGIAYSGSWNTFLQFIRGGGAIDGSLAIYTNNTSRLLLDSSGNLLPQGTTGTLNLGGTANKWNKIYANEFVGTITGTADYAINLSTTRSNWATNGTITAVVGQLAWKNYGNGHTIFDASASTSPDGTAVNNTNSQVVWSATYPTLMGWNGANTYGVRVDSARLADLLTGLTLNSSASPINPDSVTQNQLGYCNSVSLFSQSDGGLYSSAYSSSWIHQIFGDFRTGQIAIRGKNNGTWGAWRTVIDSSNIGNYSTSTNVTVLQKNSSGIDYACTAPITTSGATITIGQASNAYGRKFVSPTEPTSVCDGDIWFDTSASTGSSALSAVGSANQVIYKNSSNIATGSPNLTFDGTNLRINGNVVNTSSSSSQLIIRNSSPTIYLQDTDHRSSMIHCNSNIFYILRGDGIDSTTWSPLNGVWPLEINLTTNNATFGGAVTASSDARFKKNVRTIKDALSKTLDMRGVYFERLETDGTEVGVIAQEVEKVVPEVVTTDSKGHKSVAYANMVGLLIEAIKEQNEIITNLKKDIDELKNKCYDKN